MAVMARTLGIPARLGVGFLPGTKQANGRQGVSLNDAHAWPELYFEGAGWVRFEPTPAVRTGAAPAYSTPNIPLIPSGGSSSVPGTASPTTSGAKPRPELAQGPVFGNGTSRASGDNGFRLPVKVWVLIGLVGAGLLATPLAAVVTRWRRRRGARDADARTEAAWAELLERVDDLGFVLPMGATPRQIQDELVTRATLEPGPVLALGRLVRAIEQVRYAPPSGRSPIAIDEPDITDDVAEVVRAVRAGRDRASRLRARVVPRSGTERLVGLSARAGERIAGVDRRIARTGRSVARGPGDRSHTRRSTKIFGRRSH